MFKRLGYYSYIYASDTIDLFYYNQYIFLTQAFKLMHSLSYHSVPHSIYAVRFVFLVKLLSALIHLFYSFATLIIKSCGIRIY